MLTQGFAEVLVDILTINPALSGISSASAILDTSNYTFDAITYGKDAEGFKFHAHTVSSLVGSSYNGGYVLIRRYNSISPSSYHSSATHIYFSSTYNSIPNYPSIYDTRLERGEIETNYSGSLDLGHYTNPAIDPQFSAAWNIIGGFPPSGNVGKYMFVSSNGAFIFSGNLSGVYNTNGIVNKNGYVRINPFVDQDGETYPISDGPKLFIAPSELFPSAPILQLLITPQMGDGASLAAFGGVNHLGIYCIDIKQMLADGLSPPYAWNNLNNLRRHKLVGKVSFWNDIMIHNDTLGFSGYKTLLADGAVLDNQGPSFVILFNFI